MKRIGSGYYYNVYDIGDGRVRKIEKSFFDRALHILRAEMGIPWSWALALWRTYHYRTRIISEYQNLFATVDLTLLGNPVSIGGMDYEQDRVAMVRTSDASMEQFIDAYIENVLACWRFGFSDTVFNFTINNGLVSDGTCVLIDFNEVVFDKEEVRARIRSRRWLRSYSYLTLNSMHKNYFRTKVADSLTEEALDRLWGEASGRIG